ncbi:ABC transporter substrate-binding protein [Pseudonocardia sp. GCM10023141]|uniref:ABC transporter substrate-binding protein n=1 Tax=Pseudonocardia sp. GCM10023141 TaxID=3252653 RepID=UPI0036183D21
MNSSTSHPADRGRTRHTRRGSGPLAVLVAPLVGLLVAACGGGAAPAAPAAPPAAAASATADTFPQTLKSPFGETTLPAAPKRVVAIGVAERDTTLALGIVPVAVGGYGPIDPWFTQKLGSDPAVENLEITDGIPFEKIASFTPDLIITGWGDEAAYKQLSAIAPVLWQVNDSFSTKWRDQVTTISKALGRSAQGATLVTDLNAKIKATAAANPGLAGKTFTWSTYDPGLVNLVDLPTAPVVQFLAELGLKLKPEIADPKSVYSREVSPEQLATIDADVIIMYPSSPEAKADLERQRNWQSLSGVTRGGAVFLDDAQANALNSPTLLSLPFVLDNVTPMLAKTTKG